MVRVLEMEMDMTDEKVSLEYSARVYNDEYGYFASVGPDGDGLGLCELKYSEADGTKPISFVITWQMAEKLAGAILDIASLAGEKQ